MGKKFDKETIISKRLKKLEEILGLKPPQMADIGGCSQATYYRYRKGESIPDIIFLNNVIKNEKKIRAEWLLMGAGPVLSTNDDSNSSANTRAAQDQIEFINLPLYSMKPDNPNSEGKLTLEEWHNPSYNLPLCTVFLDGILKADSNQIFALKVKCDSMSPDIKPESLVLVDKSDNDITTDGIFIIRFDDIVRMKLLQPLPNNHLLLTTVNKKYEAVRINLEETDDFEIMGRIVWVGTPY